MKSTLKLWALALAVGSALFFSGCAKTYWTERREPTTEAERKAITEHATAILAATPRTLAGDDQDWDDAIAEAHRQARATVVRLTYWEYKRGGIFSVDDGFTGRWRYADDADEPNTSIGPSANDKAK